MPDLPHNILSQSCVSESNEELTFNTLLIECISQTNQIIHKPHPKFLKALRKMFLKDDDNQIMSLCEYRILCNKLLINSDESSTPIFHPLSKSQLHLFLYFRDSYCDLQYLIQLELSRLFNLISDSSELPPELLDPNQFDDFDQHIGVSFTAFCNMFIYLAERSPRIVWKYMFANYHNGCLDYTNEFSQSQKALISRGFCTTCSQPIGLKITRCTLRCEDCYIQHPTIVRHRYWLKNDHNNDWYKNDDSLMDYY